MSKLSDIEKAFNEDMDEVEVKFIDAYKKYAEKNPSLFSQGGKGSGNFDHSGRPGEVGGSAPSRKTLPPMPKVKNATTTREERLKIIMKNIFPGDDALLDMDPEQREFFLQSHYQMFADTLGLDVPITILDDDEFDRRNEEDSKLMGVDVKDTRGFFEYNFDGSDKEIFLRRSVVRGGQIINRSPMLDEDRGTLANNLVVSHEVAFHEIGHAYRVQVDEILGRTPTSLEEYNADEHEKFANDFSDAVIMSYWSKDKKLIEKLEEFLKVDI